MFLTKTSYWSYVHTKNDDFIHDSTSKLVEQFRRNATLTQILIFFQVSQNFIQHFGYRRHSMKEASCVCSMRNYHSCLHKTKERKTKHKDIYSNTHTVFLLFTRKSMWLLQFGDFISCEASMRFHLQFSHEDPIPYTYHESILFLQT